jgi:hypothetical protein
VNVSWIASGNLSEADHVTVQLDGNPPDSFPELQGSKTYTEVEPGLHHAIVELATAGSAALARDSVLFTVLPEDTSCDLITTGLALHLESDTGVNTNGSQVTAWLDQTANSNDLSASGEPQLVSSGGPNDTPFLRFDGIDDKLERTAPLTGFPTGGSERTVFFVTRYVSGVYGGFAYGTAADGEAFGLVTDGTYLTIQGFGASNNYPSPEPGTGEGWLTHSVVLGGVFFKHFRDGSLVDQNAGLFNTGSARAVVAEEISGAGFTELDAAAILVYDRALDENERAQVERYLQQKYFGVPCGGTVDAAEIPRPTSFALHQSRPNPFRDRTTLRFDLPVATRVDLAVYDVRGRLVRRAIDGQTMPAGRHGWVWDGRDDAGVSVGTGIYFYRLRTPQFSASKKTIVQN